MSKQATPKAEIQKREYWNENDEYVREEVSVVPEVGMKATLVMYSDCHPYEVVSVTANTITLRKMEHEITEAPEIIPGGFAGRCVKNAKYRVFSKEGNPTIKATYRPSKRQYFASGTRVSLGKAVYHYDYNF